MILLCFRKLRLCRFGAFALLGLGFILASASFAQPNEPLEPANLTLTIFHTNDLHGHLLPFDYAQIGRAQEQPSVGGAARRATLIRRLRAELANPSIVVDAGDLVQRGPLASTYEGIPDVETLNAIGYELAVIGNNEFRLKDGGDHLDFVGAQAALQRLIRASHFHWITANIIDANGALLEGVQPYVVRRFNGVRVAFLGLSTPSTGNASQAKGLTSLDAIAAAKEWIPRARAESDVLVLVSHLGLTLETKLVTETTGIDAVVGGHSHTLLREAVVVKNLDGVEVPIVQTGEFGVQLGRFSLHFARTEPKRWHLASFAYDLLAVGKDIPDAEDVKAILAPYVQPLAEVVAHLPAVPADPADAAKFTLQTVAEALRESAKTDLSIAGFGEGLFDRFHQREVTRYDLNAILAIPHHIATTNLTGAELAALQKTNPLLLIFGLNGLVPERTYSVALFDTIAINVYKLPESRLHDTGINAREAVLHFLNSQSADVPKAELNTTAHPD
jgi:5'-nucleotidase